MHAPRPRSRENRTRYVVLGMLTLGPMNGYALRQVIAGSVGHFWQESFGQLYPTLRALAADGLVQPVHRGVRDGRHGAAYEVTPRGRQALAAWLAKPPLLEPARNEVLLKVFFASAVPPEVTLRNLAVVRELEQGQLKELEAIASSWAEKEKCHPDAPLWRLTLDFGLLFTRTTLGWLEDARRVVGARTGRGASQEAVGGSGMARERAKVGTAKKRAGRKARGGGKR